MSTQIKRTWFDFVAHDYTSLKRSVEILASAWEPSPQQKVAGYCKWEKDKHFIQRWYLSLQGETTPVVSEFAASFDAPAGRHIYAYDWAFGITVVHPYWWDWQAGLPEESALAVHMHLEPVGTSALEAVPLAATLSALHPSRNTKGIWEHVWSKMPRTAAEMAALGGEALPLLKFAACGLSLGANALESYTGDQKNWFLYQFFDENRNCPVVEFRISKRVLREYGPLIRGTLVLAFHGAAESESDCLRLRLRPQIRYHPTDELVYVVPTEAIAEERQVFLEIKPTKDKTAQPGTAALTVA